MTRIDDICHGGRKVLVAYLTVGYPDIEATPRLARQLVEAGCDIIELGIPFSDPMADGITIQQASHAALERGITPELCVETARLVARQCPAPLLFMSYLNPVLSYGQEAFCQAATRAGVSGLIIPDLPPEEGIVLGDAARKEGLDLVYMLAPSSNDERIRCVAQASSGFIYAVSVTGVTGTRQELPPGFAAFMGRIRAGTSLPICVGFGISNPAQAREVTRLADGVIIGSRIIQLITADPSGQSAAKFVAAVRREIDKNLDAAGGTTVIEVD
jgi:tryptophan synthase alpha chain